MNAAAILPLRPPPALVFRDVSLGYGSRLALSELSGEVAEGELLAVVGPNGAGKSTLLRGVVGDATRLRGKLDLPGRRLRDVAYLPQRPEIDRSFPISVFEFAAMGLWRSLGAFRRIGAGETGRVAAALGRVGVAGLARRPISALSGGQMQRAPFARTILQDAPIILLDEPFTSVDAHTTEDLLGVVLDWRRQGRTVVAALHDLAQVRAHFPRALLLAGRPIAWGPTAEALTAHNLERSRRGEELCSHDHAPPGGPDAVAASAP